ncbi:MAG: GatB/YqeY domain-containing protein [Actinomycetota bacterium]
MTDPTLKAQVHQEMTDAMRAGDKTAVGALRMLWAAITLREKEILHELSDDEVREVAGKEVKKRTESIEAFQGAGRTELAEKETNERAVITPFAPDTFPEERLDALVEEAIAATGATSMKEMGKVMGMVMGKTKGFQVDGTAVQAKVRAKLGD